MNILVTGQSGSGKTTVYHQCRQDFSRESNLLIDLDAIGFRSETNWIYPVDVIKSLTSSGFNDLICFGISSNINEYVRFFDEVIVIYTEVDVPFLLNFIKREEEKNQRLGYKPKPLYDKVKSLCDFTGFTDSLECNYTVINFNDVYEHLKDIAVHLQLGRSR